MEDVLRLDATAQAELVRKREIHPIELLEAVIERIERLNPILNAVVTPLYDDARSAAGQTHGRFAGMPFLLKDVVAGYAGARMTEGSAFLKEYVADRDSELVVRLKRAGLLIAGKTNTPEFGI